MDDSGKHAARVALTRERHGTEFYARVGRKGLESRRRALAGEPSAQAILARRRAARERRRAVWLALLEAQEAVTLLREELRTYVRVNTDPSFVAHTSRLRYTEQLRRELADAERRLARCEEEHQRLLDDLVAPLAHPG